MQPGSTRASPDPTAAEQRPQLSVQPKYAPIPDFGVVVLESRHAPGWSAPGWFDEDFNKFFLLLSGAVVVRTRTGRHHLRPHSLCHAVAHTPHLLEDQPGAPVVLYVIHYRPRVLPPSLAEALGSVAFTHWNLGGSGLPMAQPIRSEFQEMLFEQVTHRVGWEAILCSSLVRLAVRAARFRLRHVALSESLGTGDSRSAEPVASYIGRLESGFFRQQTLDMAALSTGLSRRQFTRIFRQLTGTTWHEHLQALRLRHACRLLRETNTSVLAVAFECGFETPSNFHRAFREAFGCTPSAFRAGREPGGAGGVESRADAGGAAFERV